MEQGSSQFQSIANAANVTREEFVVALKQILQRSRFEISELNVSTEDNSSVTASISLTIEQIVEAAVLAFKQRQFQFLRHNHQELVENFNDLSVREKEICNLVAQGLSNKVIAAKLFVAASTIKNHIGTIFDKIGCTNRSELTVQVLIVAGFTVGCTNVK